MNDLLVSADWLSLHLGEVVVADVRWDPHGGTASAERAFERGHIPGAVFVDVDRDLAAAPFDGPGRHPLPTPAAFAASLERLGISDEDRVVAYDGSGGTLAARLWWMLDATSRAAALLDGGLGAWPGPLETGAGRKHAPTVVESRPWPAGGIVDAATVADALRSGSATVLDVRAPERYRGEVEPFDPVAGHIPGAISAPSADLIDERGRLLPPERLRERLGVYGPVIAHCGSGVTACHTVFAMRVAGLSGAVLYEGSWSDWVHDSQRPVATGPG